MSQNAHYSEYDPDWAAVEPHFPKGYEVESIPDYRQKILDLKAKLPLFQTKGATEGLKVIETHIPVENGEIRLKVFIPDAQDDEKEGFPLFQFIHSGGWIQGSVDDEETMLRNLTVKSRITCICGNQRVAPEYPYPFAIHDSEAVLKWALNNASELSVNASKGVVVGGLSSGANISAAIAHRSLKDPDLKVLSGQLLVMPCLISPHAYSQAEKYKSDLLSYDLNQDGYLLSQNQLLKFSEAYHGKDNAANPEVSPLLYDSFQGLPPAYLQAAGRDLLRDEVILYERLLREAGVPTKIDVYPGCPHGFYLVFPQFKAAARRQKDFEAGLDWLLHRTA